MDRFSQPVASKLVLNGGKCSGAGIALTDSSDRRSEGPAIEEAVCQEIGGPEASRQSRALL